MSLNRIVLFILCAIGLAYGASALTPPVGDETLCEVQGVLLHVEQQEASDMQMNKFIVPVVEMEVSAIAPMDKGYKGEFCNKLSSFREDKRIGQFRLCSETPDLQPGDSIEGVAGRSLGGGPYCIEQVKRHEP